MPYNIYVYDDKYKTREIIKNVSEEQRIAICDAIIRLGGHVDVRDVNGVQPSLYLGTEK